MSSFALLSLALMVGCPALAQGPCAMMHCGMEGAECMAENACRSILGCIASCKGDLGCQYLCGTEYLSPANEKLTACLQKNGCLKTIEDTRTPDDFCGPDLAASSVKAVPFLPQGLLGEWWVQAGLNYALDCVPCQSFIHSEANNSLYAAHQTFRSFKNRVLNTVNYEYIASTNLAQRGQLHVVYTQAGFGGNATWYILDHTAQDLVVAYCANSNWVTHGAFVLTRGRGALSSSNVLRYKQVLGASGVSWAHMCRTEVASSDCTAAVNVLF